ncbi:MULTISPECIES: ABC transporter ATP-binding protein [unclassified Streptococcus]|uniref:ABC transporter ATP-binding protein n=1 Tax=unclassified Streptococcus TaxID=2608887 RepID=UPI0011B83340|nr:MULTISPECIES: ABC transporter ATP-binding protein [unclassified Streptococcus]TWS94077.1 ABC transporter ATP-binding protein [Streptococcus sp. sy018]TWT14227.1 ABC transporter ATP-binding protein [Streptococcus sp. sy010]
MSMIEAKGIHVTYHKQEILSNLSTKLNDGQITTIIGPNGCGKSTLLKALLRLTPIEKGQILLDGQAIHSLPTKDVAKKIALLPQTPQVPKGLSTYELISYGRFPHQKYLGGLSNEDRDKIHWAMEITRVTPFAQTDVDQLSGGQRQRVWIAMALAQDTPTIFLDEPTTYLDMNHQLEILELLQDLNQQQGKTIIMVLHDLNLAARFSDYLITMKEGKIHHHGVVNQVLTKSVLREIFQIDAQITTDKLSQKPILISYQLHKGV